MMDELPTMTSDASISSAALVLLIRIDEAFTSTLAPMRTFDDAFTDDTLAMLAFTVVALTLTAKTLPVNELLLTVELTDEFPITILLAFITTLAVVFPILVEDEVY